jgi:Raf kinase inhibitor-like YbhB/YbcL family protein
LHLSKCGSHVPFPATRSKKATTAEKGLQLGTTLRIVCRIDKKRVLTMTPFAIFSHDLTEGAPMPMAQVYNGMGYAGENVSPHLGWEHAPDGTQSFAITAYDPDAPTGSGWWHWVVVNIPATYHELPTGASGHLAKPIMELRTDFGAPGYGGAAPPAGPAHRYIFTVFALNVPKLDIPTDATAAMAGFMLNAHALAKASLTVMFGKADATH